MKTIPWLRSLSFLIVLSLFFSPLSITPRPVQAAPAELFFSEYIEGSDGINNNAIEFYNGTGAAVDLAMDGYLVELFRDGSPTATYTINLTGTVASGDVYVLANPNANTTVLSQADQLSPLVLFTGDDAILLRRGSMVVDVIGQVGTDPGTEWGSGLTSTADNTLRRKSLIESGDTNKDDPFDPSIEWDGFAVDTFGGLGSHFQGDYPPAVTAVSPNFALTMPLDASIQITFSEPVAVSGAWYNLTCNVSGVHTAAVSGGALTYTLDPDSGFVENEGCTLSIDPALVTDQDSYDPPNQMSGPYSASFNTGTACGAAYTPIFQIQGSGLNAAITGQVTVEGVVVGDYEGPSPALRGFYLQDPTGDGNPATSEGIFIFNNSADVVSLGDRVRVTGAAAEFQDQTQISSAAVRICGAGSTAPIPADITLPLISATALEAYEGMLVHLPQTLYVTEHFQLGRFGQVVLSSSSRLFQPTHLLPPGPQALALQAQNDLNRIILDDATNSQNPDPIVFSVGGQPLSAVNTLRGGDTITGITGVMTYTWSGNPAGPNAYRVRPLTAQGSGIPPFVSANPRPIPPPDLTAPLKVVSVNLLNYFNTFTGCTAGMGGAPTDCRGANNEAEFIRQYRKTVAGIITTHFQDVEPYPDPVGADIIAVAELENDGYGPESAIYDLVERLNSATSPGNFAFIDVDLETGQVNALGTDAIKVGLIYKPAFVTPVAQTTVLNTGAFGLFNLSGGAQQQRNRPALAQTFEHIASKGRLTVVVNHFKSRGSSCSDNVSPVASDPDTGDGQGNCNLTRTAAAQELAAWLAGDPTGSGEKDILILGDLNAYAQEDPVAALTGAGYTNLVEAQHGDAAYSYVFDGQWGYLDHALASAKLTGQVVGVHEFHVNADEPSILDYNTEFKTGGQQTLFYRNDTYRMGDHDPLVIGLNLTSQVPSVDTGGPYSGFPGREITLSAAGSDPNDGSLTYAWDLDNDGVFETPGQTVTFTSAVPGDFSVKVQVTNTLDLSQTAETIVAVRLPLWLPLLSNGA